jgi:hypothetical protein
MAIPRLTTSYRADALSPDQSIPGIADSSALAATTVDHRYPGAELPSPSPFGTITGLAKTVATQVRRGAFSNQARVFLLLMHQESFGNAGYQRRKGCHDAGLWCTFALSRWAQELEWAKPNVCRMREHLIKLGVIAYEPDMHHPGNGILRWVTDFAAWLPLQETYRQQRFSRPGAGRPKQVAEQSSIISQITDDQQATVISLIHDPDEQALSVRLKKKIKLITKPNQTDNGGLASDQAANGASASLKKEEIEETDTIVSAPVADATVTAPPPSVSTGSTANTGTGKRERRYSGEEQRYVRELVDAFKRRLKVSRLPAEGRERAAAHWFYHAGPDDSAVSVDVVFEVYDLLKPRPFWRGTFLSLQKVAEQYVAYVADPAAFIAAGAAPAGGGIVNGHVNGGMATSARRGPAVTNPGSFRDVREFDIYAGLKRD